RVPDARHGVVRRRPARRGGRAVAARAQGGSQRRACQGLSGARAEAAGAHPRDPGGERMTPPTPILRPRRPVLSLRWIAALGAVALTTAAVLTVGAVAERNTRQALTREIET